MLLMPDKSRLVTYPSGYPITVAEAKTQLAFNTSVDDDLFIDLIRSVTNEAERYTGRRFVRQTVDIWAKEWPDDGFFELPFGWLNSVSGVYYTDTDGAETEFSSSYYDVDTDSTLGKVVLGYNDSWPSAELTPTNPIRIRFVCGRLVADEWAASTAYAEDAYAIPTKQNATGLVYRCSVAGTTDSSEPSWPLTIDGTVADNTATWTADSQEIDTQIKRALLTRVADSYEWREDNIVTQGAQLLNLQRFRTQLAYYCVKYVKGM